MISSEQLQQMVLQGESLTVEFKSDRLRVLEPGQIDRPHHISPSPIDPTRRQSARKQVSVFIPQAQ
jgi:hypothetical protein